jgi:glycosyltransferase involved in cell wall biosynthesis
MTPIQTLGVLVYNRGDLLKRLFDSLDYPIEQIVIVQNNPKDGGVREAIAAIERTRPNVIVHRSPINLGCAGGWNHLLKNHLKDWMLIVGNDIQFAPGDMAKIQAHYEKVNQPKNGVISTSLGFNVTGITKQCVEALGYFDENFYPIYYEDADFNHRYIMAEKQGILIHTDVCNINDTIHGEPYRGEGTTGSCTVHSLDYEGNVKHQESFNRNRDYYIRKWGGDHLRETFEHPFNDPSKDIKYWQLEHGRWELNAF